ncbi:MAG: hypothetical protein Q7Q71_08045 [Verrucomicrobiota bacterium JB023]|nr:hypothetical protein [Verrucomicrobiota bacterium JB023]
MRMLLLTALAASAAEVELDFQVLDTSTGQGTFRVGTVLTNTHVDGSYQDQEIVSLVYGGNLLARAEADSDDGSLSNFRFTGGSITPSAQSAVLNVAVGQIDYLISYQISELSRRPQSSSAQETVDGLLEAALHRFPYDGGDVSISNFPTADASTVSRFEQDLFNNPETLFNDDFIIGGSSNFLTVSATGTGTPFSKPYEASLLLILASSGISPDAQMQAAGLLSGQNFKMRYRETGTLRATASFDAPTPYGAWAEEQGLSLTSGLEVNSHGQPYAVLAALDLPAETASLPLRFESSPPSVSFDLPDEGSNLRLAVLYSSNLVGWETLDGDYLSGSLSKGRTGTRTVTYPEGAKGFIRLQAFLD